MSVRAAAGIALLLMVAASASGMTRAEDPDLRFDSYDTYDGGGGGGGGGTSEPQPPSGAHALPQVSTNGWLSGWWYLDPHGMDPSVKYDERSRQTGDALTKPDGDDRATAVAEDLIRYHFGWARADFTVTTQVKGEGLASVLAPDAVASTVQFLPGFGWFFGLDQNPADLDRIATVGEHIQWTRQDGEHLRVTITPQDGCTDHGTVDFFDPEQSRLVLEVEPQDLGDLNGQGYRADQMELSVGIPPADGDCTYSLRFEWALLFAYETPAATPDGSANDAMSHDPAGFVDGDDFFQSGFFLGIRDYTTEAVLTVASQVVEDGTVHGRSDPPPSQPGTNFPLTVFYAPILPVDYACEPVYALLGDCVLDKMTTSQENYISRYVMESSDVPGRSIVVVDKWQGNRAAVVHTIVDGALDFGESVVYMQPADGDVTETSFLEVAS